MFIEVCSLLISAGSGEAQGQVRKMGAKGESFVSRQNDRLDQVIELRFGESINFKCAGVQLAGVSLLSSDPRHDGTVEHGDHFLRHAGEPDEVFARTTVHSKSRRSADRIGDNRCAPRKERLFEIIVCPCNAARLEALF